MTVLAAIALFLAGILSGAINAVAGGGTFITFGILTVFGMAPIAANASASIIQFPGYATSTYAYRKDIGRFWRHAIVLAIVSAIGALAGALLLLAIDNPAFRAIVPWLLLGATLIFAAGPLLKPRQQAPGQPVGRKRLVGTVLQFFTAVYGGFFGAGMGIMMLATLGLTESDDYHRINALKNLISIVIAAVAIVVFTSGGLISWPEVLVMVPGVAIGGYLGVWAAQRVPQVALRALVVAVGLALAVYYFLT